MTNMPAALYPELHDKNKFFYFGHNFFTFSNVISYILFLSCDSASIQNDNLVGHVKLCTTLFRS